MKLFIFQRKLYSYGNVVKSYNNGRQFTPIISSSTRNLSINSKSNKEGINDRKPLKFLNSRANRFDALDHYAPRRHKSNAEGPVLALSIIVLVIYFGWLRSENDLDHMFDDSNYKIAPELKLKLLKETIEFYEKRNEDITELKRELLKMEQMIEKK
ncbi:hypothetical protein SNEBB_005842 [Seison nebaliae]|nr:hypothetical protein SNEBB_005842 [Seison nebaliae]